jgi:hypothetical protein
MSRCTRCNRRRGYLGGCACSSVRRRWSNAERRAPAVVREQVGKPVVNSAHRGMFLDWCAECGSLWRNDKCVSTTCKTNTKEGQ